MRWTMQKRLPATVHANGKLIAAFADRGQAEYWTLKRSEAFTRTTYKIEDKTRPRFQTFIMNGCINRETSA